jgi:hypothetical protein
VFDLTDNEVVDVLLPEQRSETESAVNDALSTCQKQALRIIAG